MSACRKFNFPGKSTAGRPSLVRQTFPGPERGKLTFPAFALWRPVRTGRQALRATRALQSCLNAFALLTLVCAGVQFCRGHQGCGAAWPWRCLHLRCSHQKGAPAGPPVQVSTLWSSALALLYGMLALCARPRKSPVLRCILACAQVQGRSSCDSRSFLPGMLFQQ